MLYPVRRVRPDTEARGVPAQDPSLLNVGGIGQRLGLLNQIFNPVEAIGQSMQAGQRLTAPNMGVMDRVAALGDMLSGVAGVTGPAVAAGRAGAPAAAAVMEGLLGGSPTTQAAGDMARQFVTDESGALRLYHGSPHDFDRFSMSKIGTGEGAQAYGHGLYFAEAEDVAKAYRDNIGTGVSYKGQPILANIQDGTMINPIAARMSQTGEDAETAIKNLAKYYRTEAAKVRLRGETPFRGGDPEKFATEYEQMAEEVLAVNPADFGTSGRLYEVEVNANPEDFLDWDKPLSEQSQRVRDVLGQFGMKYDEAASNDFDNALLAALFNDAPGPLPKRPINPTGNDIYMRSTLRNFAVQDDAGRWGPGASTYDESLAAAGGDPKRVRAISTGSAPDRSEALRRAGIPGIRYLDAGSRSAGDGSRNYVVFDENLIEIVRKYGIAGAAAMLGISQADVAQAMQQQQQQQPQGLLSGAQ
jgi:hypothetical protein